jgi:two-component system NtrC family response regulator
MANVLIIDDDRSVCKLMSNVVQAMDHTVISKFSLKQGFEEVISQPYDVVFLDVGMPDGNGLNVLPEILDVSSPPEVVVITGNGDPDGAELAIDNGAWAYIKKPLSTKEISLQVTRVLQYRKEKRSLKASVLPKREGIVGDSRPIRSCLELVAKAANNDSNVLITGETGTGKELFAKAIHINSVRAGGNFVVVDCGALTETLVESILFGHEKGAFTSADKENVGLIKLAHNGTLFLDEVGELPMSVQGSFLRVLQERRFRPVGGKSEIDSNFRLISATNNDLDRMVQTGKYRNDLLFRLRSITIDLPLLRKRNGDIKDIALHYMAKLCDRYNLGTKGFSPEFLEALLAYSWPGNVRELVNTLECALSVAQNEPILFPFHLPKKIRIKLARSKAIRPAPNQAIVDKHTEISEPFPNLRTLLAKTERQYFKALISFTGNDIKEVCRISGLSRAMVYSRIKKYNISRHS